jgi:hypothetical protein
MSPAYERNKYHGIRRELIEKMGGDCEKCHSADQLEFHHPIKKFWPSCRIGGITRMRRYMRDYSEGNLQLLCKPCHDSLRKFDFSEVPF